MVQQTQTKPLLLGSQVQLNTYWPQIEPLLANSPVAAEFPTDEIYKNVTAGQMTLFAFVTEQHDVELVLLLTATPSVTLPTINIVTVAGKNLRAHVADHWENFKGWCTMNGARAIDAYVPDRMEKFVENLGLKRETVHVRLGL